MASNINPNNIDGTYPVAGQDNDSQGFRTNFTNIKNNLVYAKSEIEDIQNKAIFKSALSGEILDNNFAGAVISGAEFKDIRETRVDFGTDSGSFSLDHTSAHNYTLITAGNISLSFTGFPAAGKVGRIKFEITVSSTSHTLTLPASVSKGTTGIAGINSLNTITFNETGIYLFEFWTDDGGTTIHIEDCTRPRDYFYSNTLTIQQRTPTNVGAAGDVAGMIAVDNSYMYICTGSYDGSTIIWKRSSFIAY